MRKLLALLLVLSLAVYSFPGIVLADYVIGGAGQGDLDLDENISKFPVDVVVVKRVSRYAVDVVYEELSVDVKSAIWNVNEYVYDVEMYTTSEETTVPLETDDVDAEGQDPSQEAETNEPTSKLVKAKPIKVTIVNHSDQAVLAKFTPESDYPQISFEQEPIFWNQVTVPGVLFIDTPSQAVFGGGIDPQAERFPSYITSIIIPTENYEGGWQDLVNELIRKKLIQKGESVIGSITITISPQ